MRYAQIRECDIANGPGIRVSLFVQGCPFRCEGCFNSSFQKFSGGKPWDMGIQDTFIKLGNKPHIAGYSILGGEPLAQDFWFLSLLKALKSTGKSVWVWTGYIFENLNGFQKECLEYIDVLVDGPYIAELSDPKLRFRGSSNQRVIDVPKSLASDRVVLLDRYN